MPSCRFSSKLARRLFYTSNRCDSLIPCVYLDAVRWKASFPSHKILLRQLLRFLAPKVLCCQDPFSISQNLQNQRSAGSDLSEASRERRCKMMQKANEAKEANKASEAHAAVSLFFISDGSVIERPLCARDSKEILKRLSGERWAE